MMMMMMIFFLSSGLWRPMTLQELWQLGYSPNLGTENILVTDRSGEMECGTIPRKVFHIIFNIIHRFHVLYSLDLTVEKMEFVSWICLYNLLSCKEVMDKYELNDFRISVLTKLQGRLHDNLVDQLPMLSHLKKWLAQISIAKPPPAKPTLIMEMMPQVLLN